MPPRAYITLEGAVWLAMLYSPFAIEGHMPCKMAGYKFYLNCGKYLWIDGPLPVPAMFQPYMYDGKPEDITNTKKIFSAEQAEFPFALGNMKPLSIPEALKYFNEHIKQSCGCSNHR